MELLKERVSASWIRLIRNLILSGFSAMLYKYRCKCKVSVYWRNLQKDYCFFGIEEAGKRGGRMIRVLEDILNNILIRLFICHTNT